MMTGPFRLSSLTAPPVLLLVTVLAGNGALAGESGNPMPGSVPLQKALPEAVDSELLGQQRARAVPTLQLSETTSHIDLQENTVFGTTHGSNTVSDGAFSGARGFSSLIQNTGHNVAIHESTNVNIVMHPQR